jgi:hypothetical protein
MKTSLAIASLAVAALAWSAPSYSDELLAVVSPAKSGNTAVSMDLVTEGQATAFQVRFALPKGVNSVDTSKCLSELPSSHQGTCVYRKDQNEVVAIVYNLTNEALPAGIIAIGSLDLAGNMGGGQKLAVKEFLVSDAKAKPITATPRVEHVVNRPDHRGDRNHAK